LKVLGFWYSPRLIDGGVAQILGTQCQSQSEHPSKGSDLLCTEFQLLQALLVLRSTNFQCLYEHMLMMLAEAMKFGMTLHAMRLL
jgi:hypothetical protein